MRTVAIINQKGGCGKTTVSINLASALAELGKRTLLVDMDPQSHCAVGLAVPEEQIEQSVYDVLISTSRNEPIRLTEILWQISDNFELAPSSIDLAAFEHGTEILLRLLPVGHRDQGAVELEAVAPFHDDVRVTREYDRLRFAEVFLEEGDAFNGLLGHDGSPAL